MTGLTEQPQTRPGKLRDTPVRDWIIRFAFGAGVSAVAAVVAKVGGPAAGGLFLAFPAILLASHEPLMSSMAAFLLRSPALLVDMKKGAIMRMDCDAFGPEPRCLLKWMLTPALSLE